MKRITAIILVFLTILTFAMPKSYAEIASPSTLGEDLNSVSSLLNQKVQERMF